MYVSLDGNESHDQCNDISTGTYNNNTIVPIIYISAIQKKQIIRGHHEMIALDIVVIITIHGMVTWTIDYRLKWQQVRFTYHRRA